MAPDQQRTPQKRRATQRPGQGLRSAPTPWEDHGVSWTPHMKSKCRAAASAARLGLQESQLHDQFKVVNLNKVADVIYPPFV
jgi:hypothetical protein